MELIINMYKSILNTNFVILSVIVFNLTFLFAQQTPYSGSPSIIPGQIDAEDFDDGGEGVAYHDSDGSNEGGAYRDTGVDIETSGEGGYNVGWIAADEWLEYTVDVLQSSLYNFHFRVASETAGGTFHIEFDGIDVTDQVTFDATGGWQEYTTVSMENVALNEGQQIMRFVSNSASYNVNYFNIENAVIPNPPEVQITSPLDNAIFSFNTEITITASVFDSNGTVTQVTFYADEEIIGEDLSAPYQIIWLPLIPENYDLTATAIDNDGATGTSNKVDITVLYPQYDNMLTFSHDHGFYDRPFTLNIASQLSGVTIKYALDGSDPMTSSTAFTQAAPANVVINPGSTNGRGVTPGVVIRAVAIEGDVQNSLIETRTYLFIDEVKNQDHPRGNWPDPGVNGQVWHYEMSQEVVNDADYTNLIDDALLDIPSISLVTDLDNLFDSEEGIYVNAQYHGFEWERPVSMELLNPDGAEGFQINAGLRIRGGWSRHNYFPKHAFRLLFRERYGKAKLEYPIFENEGVNEFKKLDLRTSQNYAWSNGYIWDNTMNRDVFSRDLQGQIGQPYTRSRYYHLYINGQYWGLFQSQERPEANFAESYLGGNDDEYDVVKVDIGDNWDLYEIEATDGNLDGWNAVWNATQTGFSSNANYFHLEGKNPDGTININGKKLIDIDNLIDYMIIIFYTGNFDAPVTKFSGENNPNNFYAIYNREENDGFIFLAHDNEHTLHVEPESPGDGITEDRVNLNLHVTRFAKFHPQWLHDQLSENAEYRIRFADRVYNHFFNEGVFKPERLTEIFMKTAMDIEMAIIAESARWGDLTRSKYNAWEPAIDDIDNNFFPDRGEIVLDQFEEAGLYPSLQAPIFESEGTVIETNVFSYSEAVDIILSNPNGTTGSIFYTLDGSDPRLIGGSISSVAQTAGDGTTLSINSTTRILARINNGSEWSSLHEITVINPADLSSLQLSEIHYHPLDEGLISGKEYEFIELKNNGIVDLDLSLISFTVGISSTFPTDVILEPGKFFVLASDSNYFNERYGFLPDAQFEGQLDNAGENVLLANAGGDTIIFISYDDQLPWPVSADGDGCSLVWTNSTQNDEVNDPLNWSASQHIHGSPGMENPINSISTDDYNLPNNFELYQNYPNPFNPATNIRFDVPVAGNVRITIFDVLGRKVKIIFDKNISPGRYDIFWKSGAVSTGVYFYQIEARDYCKTRKMILIK